MKKLFIATGFLLIAVSAVADWEYSTTTDKMTSQTTTMAEVTSGESLNLTFPYNGKNYGFLTIRKHPRLGQDVIFQVNKGQILCSRHRGCKINVRFDDRPPLGFEGTESADYNPKVIFFQNPAKFIKEASAAKRILVGVTLHDNGEQTLEFTSAKPLSWGSKK